MAEQYRYAAFISYSSKDAVFAKRLHRAIEGYGIPLSLGKFDLIGGGKKNRVYPVFRDREELAAGNLGDVIEANLRASAALIIVCSPNAAASPWVQKEIEFFSGLGRGDKIFAIIADSAPVSDHAGNDATPACFPPAFRGDALTGDKLEPLAADARKGKDGFRNAWLKIVAGLIGVTPGQMIDRDKRQQRERTLRSVAAMLLPLGALAAAWMNWDKLHPIAASYLQYRLYVRSDASLMTGPTGPTSAFQDCARGSHDCPVMIVLPAGQFMMGIGYEDTLSDATPLHPVSIRRFAVARDDVTFDEWQACVGAGGCQSNVRPEDNNWGRGSRPVINLNWYEAQQYVAWLRRMTGQNYRLLSESEWEYAARGFTRLTDPRFAFPWGDEEAVCDQNVPDRAAFEYCGGNQTWPVGSFAANRFGLRDMAGNVAQMLEDCYRASYEGAPADGSPMTTPPPPRPPAPEPPPRALPADTPPELVAALRRAERSSIESERQARREEEQAMRVAAAAAHYSGPNCSRIVRGGSWRSASMMYASSFRFAVNPWERNAYTGFRVARSLD